MRRKGRADGFTLIELLLVLAIIGIISGIAIPTFMGQRRRARVIGDAESNTQVLRMQMETYKADNGIYSSTPNGNTYAWTGSGGTAPAAGTAGAAYNFLPKGNSRMNYSVAIAGSGLVYTITVTDPSYGAAAVYTINQAGSAVVAKY